jgi:opacity protein-like surface antigen
MKKFLLLASWLACGPALAQGDGTGWYIGGGLGSTKADFVRSDFTGLATGTYTAEDDEFGSRFFGGYRLSPNLAVEGSIALLGTYKHRYDNGGNVAVYDYNASALAVALAGRVPVAGRVSLLGRVGIAFTASELDLRRDNGTANTPVCPDSWWFSDCSSRSTNFYWGVGAQFDLGQRWGIRVDYDNYGEVGEEFEVGRADIEQVTVNFVWRF